jgi:hypothetical protein
MIRVFLKKYYYINPKGHKPTSENGLCFLSKDFLKNRFKKLGLYLLLQFPRKRHLKGTLIHRAIGERLFEAELWRFTQRSVSGGAGIGSIHRIYTLVGSPDDFSRPGSFPITGQYSHCSCGLLGYQPIDRPGNLSFAI